MNHPHEVTAYLRSHVADHGTVDDTGDLEALFTDPNLTVTVRAIDSRAAAEDAYVAGLHAFDVDDVTRRWPLYARRFRTGELIKVTDSCSASYYRVTGGRSGRLHQVPPPENPVLPLHRVEGVMLAYPASARTTTEREPARQVGR